VVLIAGQAITLTLLLHTDRGGY